MTDGMKTSVFVGIALLVAVLAAISYPRADRTPVAKDKEAEGNADVLFPEFDDPAKAASIEITRYNQELGESAKFEVRRDERSGAWTLPSHEDYPADAENRMRDAALLLVDLRSLGVATELQSEHQLFGVVAPDKNIKVGERGVGMLVRFRDKKNQLLGALVIGNKVKGQENQRFVRIADKDPVHVVKIDPDKLSTKFEDWIEKDLLKLSGWDIENVAIKSYSANPQLRGGRVALGLDKKFDMAVNFKDGEWKLQELTKYSGRESAKVELAPNEELNKDKLNDLKSAVDDMAIVNVVRKPAGLGADLKMGENFTANETVVKDLFERGFYAVEEGKELLNANGEVLVTTKDGVQYLLRFGETVGGSGADASNRYLFVTARVDMAKFPPPQLEALPDAAGKPEPAKPVDAKPVDAKPVDANPEAKPEEPKPAAKPEEPKVEAKHTASEPDVAKPEAKPAETPAKAEEKTPEAGPAAKDSKTGAKPAETPAKTDAKAEEKKPEAKAAKDADKEAKEAALEKERERITKENQRKIDERKEKLQKAEEKVAELNVRFAEWYYVVAEKEYKRIQLELGDLIKQKEADKSKPGDETSEVGDFRKLQEEGLKK